MDELKEVYFNLHRIFLCLCTFLASLVQLQTRDIFILLWKWWAFTAHSSWCYSWSWWGLFFDHLNFHVKLVLWKRQKYF